MYAKHKTYLSIYLINSCLNKEAVMMNRGDDHDQELLEAQAHIWNHIFSFINSMSLKCAVELDIPDVIHHLNLRGGGNPATVSELIDALQLDKAKTLFLSRLMRILTHSGFFIRAKKFNDGGNDDKEEEEEGYILTSASKLLLKDNPLSLSPFLRALLDPIMTEPWHRLSDWFRSHNDTSPFVTNHGKEFWEMASQEPRFNNLFNEAMASDARLVSSLIIGNNNNKKVFEGLSSLVDVGGGTGNLSKDIAKTFPEMKCTVMDLPHVVQGLKGTKNLSYVGGDMFQSIPPTHAILLKVPK